MNSTGNYPPAGVNFSCLLCRSVDDELLNCGELPENSADCIATVVSKHFWMRPDPAKLYDTYVCRNCWRSTWEFHKFYLHIESIHNVADFTLPDGMFEENELPAILSVESKMNIVQANVIVPSKVEPVPMVSAKQEHCPVIDLSSGDEESYDDGYVLDDSSQSYFENTIQNGNYYNSDYGDDYETSFAYGIPGDFSMPKQVPMKESCAQTCRLKCNYKFSEQDRVCIYTYYWSLDRGNQCKFIERYIQKGRIKKSTVPHGTIKQSTFHYSFEQNGRLMKVCKMFFLNTLAISSSKIYHYFRDRKAL